MLLLRCFCRDVIRVFDLEWWHGLQSDWFAMGRMVLIIVLGALAGIGCGQKSALYMEGHEPPAEKRAKEAALKRAKAEQKALDDASDDAAIGGLN